MIYYMFIRRESSIMTKLDKARSIINRVDKEMASLFCERMEAAKLVAEYKAEHGLPIFDAQREKEVIKNNSTLVADDIFREYYVPFLQNVMDISKSYQHRLLSGMKVAYSGVEGAFAHIAACRIFPDGKAVSYPDFISAYEAVAKGECDAAVLPVENSYAGEVGQVTDLVFQGSLYINGIYELAVNQNLLALPGTDITKIKMVVSHPQALAQCASFISEHGFSSIPYENTALAAKYVKDSVDMTLAAIASEETAELYGLSVLVPKINMSNVNTTKFAVLTRSLSGDSRGKGYCSAILFTVKNEAGSLAGAIDIIGSHRFNMRTLRSRPLKGLLWEYYFYAELEGDVRSEEGSAMLSELSKLCDNVKVAGVYLPHMGI